MSTLVFDEIDSGVGGETAHFLADSLRRACQEGRQIVVITHLAQIASRADNHLVVRKSFEDEMPVTRVLRVEGDDRLDELERILGGGSAAREHAQAMLSRLRV